MIKKHGSFQLFMKILISSTRGIPVWAFTCSKLTIETQEQDVKYVQS